MPDLVPTSGEYRGVGIHAGQPPARVAVVRAAIDRVHGMTDPRALFDYAGDARHPPEARLFAAAKVEAAFEIAAEERRVRPDVEMDVLRASVTGLGSVKWRHPTLYCSLFDVHLPGQPGPARREKPLR